jgi:UDP-2,3-diacylglucosamine pyrophosphatase LpxH
LDINAVHLKGRNGVSYAVFLQHMRTQGTPEERQELANKLFGPGKGFVQDYDNYLAEVQVRAFCLGHVHLRRCRVYDDRECVYVNM